MWTGRVIAAFCAPLIALGAAGGVAAQRSESFAHQLLALHNAARDDAGVPRLAWSSKLAQDARGWAERLARDGRMYHATHEQSEGEGENLWMGSAGYYGPETMIGAFTDEKRHWCNVQIPVRQHYYPITPRGALATGLHRGWAALRLKIKGDERLLKWAKALRGLILKASGRAAPAASRD